MTILRSLLVNLGLNSGQYRTDLDRTQKKTKSAFSEMTGVMSRWKGSAVVAIAAVGASTAAMVSAAVRDQSNLARTANMSITEYKTMALAAKQYGITVEQIGGMTDDAVRNLAEYATAGTGAFQDFADVMKLSDGTAQKWARSMESATGREILTKMVTDMEAAGVSTNRMRFALDSLASESDMLLPAIKKNSEGFTELEVRANDALAALALDPKEEKAYKDLAFEVDLLGKTAMATGEKVGTNLAGGLHSAAKWATALISSLGGSELALKKMRLASLEGGLTGIEGFLHSDGQKENIKIMVANAKKDIAEYEALIGKSSLGEFQPWDPSKFNAKTLLSPSITKSGTGIKDDKGGKKDELKTMKELDDMIIEQQLFYNSTKYEQQLEADKKLEDLAKKRADSAIEYAKIEQQSHDSDMANLQSGFQQIAQMAAEGSALQKVMFVASQAIALSDIFVQNERAKAMAAPIAALSGGVAAVTASDAMFDARRNISVGLLATQTVAGVFHGGGAVPKNNGEQTYLLKGGEYVESEAERRKIDSMVSGGGGVGGSVGAPTIIVQGSIYGDAALKQVMTDSVKNAYNKVAMDFRSNGVISRSAKR